MQSKKTKTPAKPAKTAKPTARKPRTATKPPEARKNLRAENKDLTKLNFTVAQRAFLKAEISKLYLDGFGVYQMQNFLKDKKEFSVSIPTIYRYIDLVLEDWHRENVDNIDKQISGELMKLSRAEAEYWDAWMRSKGSVNHRTVRRVGKPKTKSELKDGETTETLKTTEREETVKTIDLIGDPRFLEGYERCVAKRIEVLTRGGFYTAPEGGTVNNTMNQTIINVGVVNPNELKK